VIMPPSKCGSDDIPEENGIDARLPRWATWLLSEYEKLKSRARVKKDSPGQRMYWGVE
jgi:hypothetical protein